MLSVVSWCSLFCHRVNQYNFDFVVREALNCDKDQIYHFSQKEGATGAEVVCVTAAHWSIVLVAFCHVAGQSQCLSCAYQSQIRVKQT